VLPDHFRGMGAWKNSTQGCHVLEKSWIFCCLRKSLNFVYKSLNISGRFLMLHRDRIVKLVSLSTKN